MKLIPICVLSTIAVSGVLLFNASAQDTSMTDQQVQLIRENCLSTKNTLNQLHASDALLRVNMGQIYESVGAKLMDSFDKRVSNNGYNDIDLISATKNYRSMLDTFRTDYRTYEEQLAKTLNVDCQKQPTVFYDEILLSRIKRSQVSLDIKNLNQNIDQYQIALSQFEKDFQIKNNGTKK